MARKVAFLGRVMEAEEGSCGVRGVDGLRSPRSLGGEVGRMKNVGGLGLERNSGVGLAV